VRPLLIVDTPRKLDYLQKHLGETYDYLCTNGLLYDLPRERVGVDVFNGFNLEQTLLPAKLALAEKLLKFTSPFFVVTSPNEEGTRLYSQVLQLLRLPPKTKAHVCPAYLTPEILKELPKYAVSLNHNLLDAAEARRAVERLSGVLLSEFLHKVIPLFGYSSKGICMRDYISYSAASILLHIHSRTLLLHSQNLGSHMFLKTTSGFSAGEVVPNPACSIENLLPRYSDDPIEAEATFKRVQEYTQDLKMIETKEIQGQWTPPSSLSTEALHTYLFSLFTFQEGELLKVLNLLFDEGHISFYHRTIQGLNTQLIETIRTHFEKSNIIQYLDSRKLATLEKRGLGQCILPLHFDSTRLVHEPRAKEIFEAILNLTRLFFCKPMPRKEVHYLFALRKHRFLGKVELPPKLDNKHTPPFDFTYLKSSVAPKDKGEDYAVWLYTLEALNEGMTVEELLAPFQHSPSSLQLITAVDQLLNRYKYLELTEGKYYLTEQGFTCSELLLSFYSQALSLDNYKQLQLQLEAVRYGKLSREWFLHEWFTSFKSSHENVMIELEMDTADKPYTEADQDKITDTKITDTKK